MSERIKTINRYYKDLEYKIDKQILATTSIIEKNISIFKSACDHVDTVTTILNFLYTTSAELTFKNNYIYEEAKVIYLMFIVCEEHEIPSFLKAALIDNSTLAHIDKTYKQMISDYIIEMIILEDSDLYAVISYLKITPSFLLKIKKILVQESIKHKFLWLIEKNFKNLYTCDLPIFVFHTKKELKLISSFTHMCMISIWSENIVTAKTLAIVLNRDISFINAHLEFSSNITFCPKIKHSSFDLLQLPDFKLKDKPKDKINPNEQDSVCDLFYDGTWQKPVKNTYWIHNGNTYAYATPEDLSRCLKSAEKAFLSWSNTSINFRIEILENLASTLECNGKFLLAATVMQWMKLSLSFSNLFECQDERLEVARIRKPKGVLSIFHNKEDVLFSYLTLSLMFGNCVIVLYNGQTIDNSCTQYFNMFATAKIPPGVINLLLNKDLFQFNDYSITYPKDAAHKHCTSTNNIILCLK